MTGAGRIAVVAHNAKSMDGGLPALRKLLAEEGHDDPLWYEVDKSRKAPKRVRKAIAAGADLLLVWGGDGTVQRCLDALPRQHPPVIAVLPAGTANLFATNLDIPKDLEGALAVALHGAERVMDTGRINGERFAVMAGAGFDSQMIAGADGGMKDRMGRLAYVVTGLKATKHGRQAMLVSVDGQRWFKGRASCVMAGNLGTIMGGVSAFDDARPDSGHLEVAVVTAKGPWQWARVLSRMAAGRSEKSPLVRMTSGRKIRVEMAEKTVYELDGGDRPPTRKLQIRVEPAWVTVRVPHPS